MFYCQGCKEYHVINDSWSFNGDFDNPTISPSILVTGTIHPTDDEVKRILSGEYVQPKDYVCHSFIENGKIRYLSDCTHGLANQTVELTDLPDK